jgi:hypothetical protein
MTHCSGDAAIVKDRGPLAFRLGSSHRLFADGRLHLVSEDNSYALPSLTCPCFSLFFLDNDCTSREEKVIS